MLPWEGGPARADGPRPLQPATRETTDWEEHLFLSISGARTSDSKRHPGDHGLSRAHPAGGLWAGRKRRPGSPLHALLRPLSLPLAGWVACHLPRAWSGAGTGDWSRDRAQGERNRARAGSTRNTNPVKRPGFQALGPRGWGWEQAEPVALCRAHGTKGSGSCGHPEDGWLPEEVTRQLRGRQKPEPPEEHPSPAPRSLGGCCCVAQLLCLTILAVPNCSGLLGCVLGRIQGSRQCSMLEWGRPRCRGIHGHPALQLPGEAAPAVAGPEGPWKASGHLLHPGAWRGVRSPSGGLQVPRSPAAQGAGRQAPGDSLLPGVTGIGVGAVGTPQASASQETRPWSAAWHPSLESRPLPHTLAWALAPERRLSSSICPGPSQ